MNHHCHAGSGRSLDLRKWEEPGSVSSESPHLTSSLPSLPLPALYLLPGKALFLFPRYAILPRDPLSLSPHPVLWLSWTAAEDSFPVCLLLCRKSRAPTGMPGYMPRVPGLVVEPGLLGADSALGRDFPATLWPPSQKEAGPRGRLGQDGSDVPRPTTTHLESL